MEKTLDYPYFKDSYNKMIAVYLSKQQVLDADPRANQQISIEQATQKSMSFLRKHKKLN